MLIINYLALLLAFVQIQCSSLRRSIVSRQTPIEAVQRRMREQRLSEKRNDSYMYWTYESLSTASPFGTDSQSVSEQIVSNFIRKYAKYIIRDFVLCGFYMVPWLSKPDITTSIVLISLIVDVITFYKTYHSSTLCLLSSLSEKLVYMAIVLDSTRVALILGFIGLGPFGLYVTAMYILDAIFCKALHRILLHDYDFN